MAGASMTAALQQVARLFREGTVLSLSDDRLLDRFLDGGDEDAFAALVARHGPMALGACLDVLRDPADAEDAFQKTFLALVRHGRSIRGRDCVGGWLRRVARRSALEVNADRLRRRRQEQIAAARAGRDEGSGIAEGLDRSELTQAVNAEIGRLPEHYQRPVVLCLLEGLPQAEAASRLRVSEGVVRGRLARARALLRERLTRRGMAPARPSSDGEPTVPAAWVGALLAAARALQAGRSARVGWAGVAIRGSAALLVMAGAVCLATALPRETPAPPQSPGAPTPAPRQQPIAAAQPVVAGDEADPGRTVVFRGKVLGPDGRPVVGARLWMVADAWASPVGHGVSDPDGSYRIVLPESHFRRNFTPSATSPRVQIALIATAEGFGPAWEQIQAETRNPQPTVRVDLSKVPGLGQIQSGTPAAPAAMKPEYVHDLHLAVDRPIEGRLVDAEGKGVSGAIVKVHRIRTVDGGDWKPILDEFKDLKIDNLWRGFGYVFPPDSWEMIPAATSDSAGRFRLAGIGRDRMIDLRISGPAIRPVDLSVMTVDDVGGIARALREAYPRRRDANGFFIASIDPPRGVHPTVMLFDASPVIEVDRGQTVGGVVRNARTGEPITEMHLYITNRSGDGSGQIVADDRGRYRGTRPGGKSSIWVHAISYKPDRFLSAVREVDEANGPGEVTADFDIESGVMVTGRVMEAGTGRPIVSSLRGDCHVQGHVVAGRVEYYPLSSNTALRPTPTGLYFAGPPTGRNQNTSNWIEQDGRFRLVVPPGPGVLLIRAKPGLPMMTGNLPVWEESMGFHRLFPYSRKTARVRDDGAPGDDPKSFPGFSGPIPVSDYHAYKVINPPADAKDLSVDISIARAPSRLLRFLGPDGRPVRGVTVAGLLPPPLAMISLDGSEAEALALDPDRPRPLLVLSHDGAYFARDVLDVADRRPRNIMLERASSVSGRVLDAATGRPIPGFAVIMSYANDEERRIPDMEGHRILSMHTPLKTGVDGRFLLRGLIPGLELSVSLQGPLGSFAINRPVYRPDALQRLTLRHREARDLGDLRITIPR